MLSIWLPQNFCKVWTGLFGEREAFEMDLAEKLSSRSLNNPCWWALLVRYEQVWGKEENVVYDQGYNFGDLITPWPLTETWLMVTTGYPKSHHSKKVQNCSSTVNLGCLTVELQVLPWKIPVIYCTWIRHYTSLGIYSVKILKRKNWWNSISGQDLTFDLELFKVTTDLLKGTWFSIGLIFIVLFTFYH